MERGRDADRPLAVAEQRGRDVDGPGDERRMIEVGEVEVT
jgi:hypothetical protein